MPDIGELYGITANEAMKLRGEGINTVEDFEALADANFALRIELLANSTNIKRERLAVLMPPQKLPVERLPDNWIDGVMARVLGEAEPDEPWLKRCRSGLQRWRLNLKGHWRGWAKNWQLLLLPAAVILLVALVLRAAGRLANLPAPLGLSEKVLVTARDLKEGRVLNAGDLYGSLLSPGNEYFKATEQLEGLKLRRNLEGQRPLRYSDVSRLQVKAKVNIPSGEIIKETDVEAVWEAYQPDALTELKKVVNQKAKYNIQQGTVIPCAAIDPTDPTPCP